MNKPTLGIPRGMLYYRYADLWKVFFDRLGINVVLSTPTTQETVEVGSSIAIDETCLSLKVFFGHVQSLIGKCDYILIPRVSNFGRDREMCPRFEAQYDFARNAFRQSGQRFISYEVDVNHGKTEEAAFVSLGMTLGASAHDSRKAYSAAKKESDRLYREKVKQQHVLYEKEGLKVLVAAHSYVIEDAYMGKPIMTYLAKHGAIPLRADRVERDGALKASAEASPTCKWEMNREIIGGVQQNRSRVDGVILLSTFPCGSDAMVNDLLLRQMHGLPVLNLVLDGQSGTAGLETRLESFLDIIRFKKGAA